MTTPATQMPEADVTTLPFVPPQTEDDPLPDETALFEKEPQFLFTEKAFRRCLLSIFEKIPFFVRVARYIRMVPTSKLDTAGVTVNPKTTEIILYWNPAFVAKLSAPERVGLLIHEFYHIIFHHVVSRRREPFKVWNIAADCAINSIIEAMTQESNSTGFLALPECGILPGRSMTPEALAKLAETHSPKDMEQIVHFDKLIANLPKMKAAEFYFTKIIEDMQQNPDGYGPGQIVLDIFGSGNDDHSMWSDLPEEIRDRLEDKIRQIVSQAQRDADTNSSGWGSIPADIQADIRRYTSNVVDWKTVLRQFVGQLIRANKSTSFKKINRKYPWIHPGKKQSFAAKLLIEIDESGSVSDEMMAEFFAELASLNKSVEIDFGPFDCTASADDIKTFQKGKLPDIKRTKTGGTNFDAPTDIVNDVENRGRWDGILILTDGLAPAPGPCSIKRGWVLPKKCELNFETNELVISIEEGGQYKGVWR